VDYTYIVSDKTLIEIRDAFQKCADNDYSPQAVRDRHADIVAICNELIQNRKEEEENAK